MKYFGLFTFGFGFLGCAYFFVMGVLHIVSPAKVPGWLTPFLTRKQKLRLAQSVPNAGRRVNAVVGATAIGFAVVVMVTLVRSLLYNLR